MQQVVGRSLAALYGEAIFFFLLAVAIDKLRTDARWSESLSTTLRDARHTLTAHALALVSWLREGRRRPYLTYVDSALATLKRREHNGGRAATAYSLKDTEAEADVSLRDGDEGHASLLGLGRASSSAAGVTQQMVSMGRAGLGSHSEGRAGSHMMGRGGSLLTGLASSGSGGVFEGYEHRDSETGNGKGLGVRSSMERGFSDVSDGAMRTQGENPDVADERRRLDQKDVLDSDAIAIRHLSKVYPTSPPKVRTVIW